MQRIWVNTGLNFKRVAYTDWLHKWFFNGVTLWRMSSNLVLSWSNVWGIKLSCSFHATELRLSILDYAWVNLSLGCIFRWKPRLGLIPYPLVQAKTKFKDVFSEGAIEGVHWRFIKMIPGTGFSCNKRVGSLGRWKNKCIILLYSVVCFSLIANNFGTNWMNQRNKSIVYLWDHAQFCSMSAFAALTPPCKMVLLRGSISVEFLILSFSMLLVCTIDVYKWEALFCSL